MGSSIGLFVGDTDFADIMYRTFQILIWYVIYIFFVDIAYYHKFDFKGNEGKMTRKHHGTRP